MSRKVRGGADKEEGGVAKGESSYSNNKTHLVYLSLIMFINH